MNYASPLLRFLVKRKKALLLVVVMILAAPFALLHILVLIIGSQDAPIQGTKRMTYLQPDGSPFYADFRPANAAVPTSTLVFIHGTPASASAFSCQFGPSLFPEYDLISINRPGFGGSPGGDNKSNLRYQTDCVLSVLKTMRTDKAILIGHSYGAPVAVQAATEAPDRVAGVVLIGGCLSPAEEHPWTIQYFGNWPVIRSLLPEPVRACNQELLYLKADLIELDKKLPNFNCPLFMLHGTQDDQVPVANVAYTEERFSELGKHALFFSQVIPGYNHFMMWEHPDVVNSAIAEFAKKTAPQNAPAH